MRFVGHGGRRRRGGRGTGVDGGDDGEVVLEFVEVVVRGGGGAVERVEEGRVEGTEGEFVDDVGEVEGWMGTHTRSLVLFALDWYYLLEEKWGGQGIPS